MNTFRLSLLTSLLIGLIACGSESTNQPSTAKLATPPQRVIPVQNTPPATTQLIWYDGDRQRSVWVNPNLVAEFSPSSSGERKIKSQFASAKTVAAKGAIRFWQVSEAKATSKKLNSSLQANQAGFSPVLHDSANTNSQKRALPGNIIVHLKPDWDQAQIDNWLSSNALEIVEKLNFGQNIFLIKSSPGLASLDLANRLHLSGEVVAAYPNWWKEVAKK